MIVESNDALRQQMAAPRPVTAESLLMYTIQEIEFIQSGLSRMLLAQVKLSTLLEEPGCTSALKSALQALSLQLCLGTKKLERMLKVCGDFTKGRLAEDLFIGLLREFVTFLSGLETLLETMVLPELLRRSGSQERLGLYDAVLAYSSPLDHSTH